MPEKVLIRRDRLSAGIDGSAELAETGHYAFLDPRQPAFEVLPRELRALV